MVFDGLAEERKRGEFDDLLDADPLQEIGTDHLKPTRNNLHPLLDDSWKNSFRLLTVYGIASAVAFLVLNQIIHFRGDIHYFWYFATFIGVAAFIDQIFKPNENSKLGYLVLLAMYYLVYKFVIFSIILYYVLQLFKIDYELHYYNEIMPVLIVFVLWSIGQKVGYYFEHQKLVKLALEKGSDNLNDIDKLKIFLYQVRRRSFLKMMIQRKQAIFRYTPTNPWNPTPKEFQTDTRLIYLNMHKFLKYLKINNDLAIEIFHGFNGVVR